MGQLIRFKGSMNALDVEEAEADAAAEAAAADSVKTDESKNWRALDVGALCGAENEDGWQDGGSVR